ncbi:hypothetical protein [Staphylococcus aureus]|uniref:hypothetical protein n=1 Tax=Staphylococcus aureus TaxID=1280 RepID=UPI001F539EA9|nr:hypothetical protein [Staphylococcus aureus]
MKGLQQMSHKGTTRFKSKPGHLAQFEWKPSINFKMKGNQIVSIKIGDLLLSYSRFIIMQLTMSKSRDVLFNLLIQAFELMEDVLNELVKDNMKNVMEQPRSECRNSQINRRFKKIAEHFNFKSNPCIASRPRT